MWCSVRYCCMFLSISNISAMEERGACLKSACRFRLMDKEKKMQIQMSSARNAGVYQDLTVSVPGDEKPPASPEHERLKSAEDVWMLLTGLWPLSVPNLRMFLWIMDTDLTNNLIGLFMTICTCCFQLNVSHYYPVIQAVSNTVFAIVIQLYMLFTSKCLIKSSCAGFQHSFFCLILWW